MTLTIYCLQITSLHSCHHSCHHYFRRFFFSQQSDPSIKDLLARDLHGIHGKSSDSHQKSNSRRKDGDNASASDEGPKMVDVLSQVRSLYRVNTSWSCRHMLSIHPCESCPQNNRTDCILSASPLNTVNSTTSNIPLIQNLNSELFLPMSIIFLPSPPRVPCYTGLVRL